MQEVKWLTIFFFLFLVFFFFTGFFSMTLGAGGRSFFGFILLVEFFVTVLAIGVHRLGLILFYFFLFGKFFLGLFTLGRFAGYFVALDAFFNVVALFEIGQRFAVFIMMAFATAIFI